MLKARYRILLKRLDAEITNVSNTIIACIVLHNFCILENDGILAELIRKESQSRNLMRRNYTVYTDGRNVREISKRHVNL